MLGLETQHMHTHVLKTCRCLFLVFKNFTIKKKKLTFYFYVFPPIHIFPSPRNDPTETSHCDIVFLSLVYIHVILEQRVLSNWAFYWRGRKWFSGLPHKNWDFYENDLDWFGFFLVKFNKDLFQNSDLLYDLRDFRTFSTLKSMENGLFTISAPVWTPPSFLNLKGSGRVLQTLSGFWSLPDAV